MSTSSTVNVGAEGDVFSEHHSTLPPPVTVLEASDIPKASAEALQLLKSFDDDAVEHFLQTDSLDILSDDETRALVGSVCARVSRRTQLRGAPTLDVRVESSGKISGTQSGTLITARLTMGLDTLEQHVQEFVKLSGCPMKRVTDLYKEDTFYRIVQTLTINEEVNVSEYLIPVENSEGMITEAGNVVLQKLLVLKGVPSNCVFIGIDQNAHVCPVAYATMEKRLETVEDSQLEVFGIQRIMSPLDGDPVEWHSYYSPEGCLISRKVVGSPVLMKVTTMPSVLYQRAYEETVRQQYLEEKRKVHWETDLELHSKFLDRKRQLSAEHASYAARHPDLRALLSGFVQHLLTDKPSDVLDFCAQYFDAFSPTYTTVDVVVGSGDTMAAGSAGSAGDVGSVHALDTAERPRESQGQPAAVDDEAAEQADRRSTQKTGSVASIS